MSFSYMVYICLSLVVIIGVILYLRGKRHPELIKENTTLPPEVSDWLQDLTPEQLNAARSVGIGDRRKITRNDSPDNE